MDFALCCSFAFVAGVPVPRTHHATQCLLVRENLPTGVASAVSVVMEGSRPLLVEVQALCSPAHSGAPQYLDPSLTVASPSSTTMMSTLKLD